MNDIQSRFIKIPAYYPVVDGKGDWISGGELIFYYAPLNINISISKFSVNNLASIPWFFRRVFNINGPHRIAAALHDGLYGGDYCADGLILTRQQCDQIFLEAMTVSKNSILRSYPATIETSIGLHTGKYFDDKEPVFPKWKAKLMYKAVRLGGGSSFISKGVYK